MPPQIKPTGIGDLKVIKQKLARYEAGEIAHIENVMASEYRSRGHRRLRQFEERVTLDQERLEENKRDLQSTERFEIQNEIEKTTKEETSFQAGLDISASYGPFVQVSAFARFSTSSATEESNKNSTKYGKEITEKSLSNLVEKLRQERVTRTLEEFEEKNLHRFDNKSGTNHISGIYRWVDKYYRAKVVNYGKRLMYEFFVPEPAAFYLFATEFNMKTNVLPVMPVAPTRPGTSTTPPTLLSPDDIDRTNYLGLVKQYNVQGVEPPPPEQIVISKAFSREFPDAGAIWALSNEELKVPKGYVASTGSFIAGRWANNDPALRFRAVFIGQNVITSLGTSLAFGSVSDVIPISAFGYGHRALIFNIEILCTLTDEWEEKWQLQTFNAIMNAYNKQLLDYEEKLAALQVQQGVQIGGTNPLINREIEKEELKKGCLTLWTSDNFNNPHGITHNTTASSPNNYPEINLTNAIANSLEIQLFEEAFDWKNITYEFFPYFWGRKNRWLDIYPIENNDPIFERFLKAGAARVIVPVQPTFTEAVLYYQLTGLIWSGGPVPALGSVSSDPEVELYNSYIEEMATIEDIVDIDREVEISEDDEDTWLMKMPTTLVWLQQEESVLPNFEES